MDSDHTKKLIAYFEKHKKLILPLVLCALLFFTYHYNQENDIRLHLRTPTMSGFEYYFLMAVTHLLSPTLGTGLVVALFGGKKPKIIYWVIQYLLVGYLIWPVVLSILEFVTTICFPCLVVMGIIYMMVPLAILLYSVIIIKLLRYAPRVLERLRAKFESLN